jgi:starch synthase (maltosyl-transferring)
MEVRRARGRQGRADQWTRLVVENVTPELDCGRFPVKRIVGDTVVIEADIFKEGHDLLRARARYRGPCDDDWRYAPLVHDYDRDRWTGTIAPDRIGRWTFGVEAWTDVFATWRDKLAKKAAARQDVGLELLEGAALVAQAARRVRLDDARRSLDRHAAALRDEGVPPARRAARALEPELRDLMDAYATPRDLTSYPRELAITVDRERAAFAAWYEMFPRSQSPVPGEHGTFADAELQLPRLAELGFDVVYLPPIHPIGRTFRKGPNNSLESNPGNVGSPWAIGNEHGGHTAVDPNLGTIEDFERFVRRAGELGMEVALDFALQASPDHPWVREHPDWFVVRPDGTIQYAENPPKKYQDIYPFDFWSEDRAALWAAFRDALLFWIERGVRTFRVDNPHTKPFAFWEWVIGEVRRDHPDVVFLSEAFTRPKKLLHLAKVGFTQSYTYFTWKNSAWELREFMAEFSRPEVLEYYRGNLFTNTPDILHAYLQTGGAGAFRARLLLAATLSPLYGIYSGFELLEHEPVRPGSEEYLDSEKYQLRQRDFDAPGNLDAEIRLLNRIRREQPALQRADNLTFHDADDPNLLFYRKAAPPGADDLLVVVNVSPHAPHAGMVAVPVAALGLAPDETYTVEDLLTGDRYSWRGERNYVRLDPARQPGHLLRVERPAATARPAEVRP